MERVSVFRSFNPSEAQLVCSRLQAAGFGAEVRDELSALSIDGYSMAAGGIRVDVPADQAADAQSLIAASDESAGGTSA